MRWPAGVIMTNSMPNIFRCVGVYYETASLSAERRDVYQFHKVVLLPCHTRVEIVHARGLMLLVRSLLH